MKQSEKYAVASVSIGIAASLGFYLLWSKAHWAVYPILAFIVAALMHRELLKQAASRAIADDTQDDRKKSGSRKRSATPHDWTLETLRGSLNDLSGGKASKAQLGALERLGMGEAPATMTADQAGAILSARAYGAAVADSALKDAGKARAILPALIAFIINDHALRDRVIRWNERSFARGGGDKVTPKKDEYWKQVFAEAERLGNRL